MAIETIPIRCRSDLGCLEPNTIYETRGHISPPGHLAVHPLNPVSGVRGEDNLGMWGVTEITSGLSITGHRFTLQEALYFRAKLDNLWPKDWVDSDRLPIVPPEIGEKVRELAELIEEGGIPSWEL